MKSLEEVLKELDNKIPASVVQEREGGGIKLSYLAGWYVIKRLNEVLTQGNWCYTTEAPVLVWSGTIDGVHYTSYTALVSLTVYWNKAEDKWGTTFTDIGYGDGRDRKNPGKAHELAVKEAVTDGLKRCAKNLGMSMGLALYDKTQEFVDDEVKPETEEKRVQVVSSNSKKRPAPQKEMSDEDARNLLDSIFKTLKARNDTALIDDVKAYVKKKFSKDSSASLHGAELKDVVNYAKGALYERHT